MPEMTRLERACPTAAHWTEQQYRDLLAEKAPTRVAFVAQKDQAGEAAGFLIARHLPPEWELENIVVAAECRRNGIGTGLYERLGFQQTGRRKSYYSAPLEDAVLYSKNLREGRNSA